MLCLDLNEHLNVREGTFVDQFVKAGVGDNQLGEAIENMCDGIRHRLFRVNPSLEHIDSLLSLTG